MRKFYLALSLIMCLCNSLSFGDDYWESIYSSDESIHCLAINSNGNLFAGVNGIVKSTDNGSSWNCVGLNDITVYSLTITANDYIFAGTGGLYNIYKSTDNGSNWSQQHPNTGNIISLFTNSNDNIFAGSGEYYGIIKATDNGTNWDIILSLPSCEQVYSIVENSQGVLFAGSINFIGTGYGGGVYRSIDHGATWEHVGLAYEYVSSLAINSNDEIFAGSRGQHYQFGGGVFRSSDNGDTWVELRNDVLVTSIAIDSENKIFIGCSDLDGYIGAVHYSQDNGQTWQRIQSDLVDIYTGIEFLLISDDDYAYAISYGGSINDIFRSVNPTVGVEIDDPPMQESTITLTNYPNPFKINTIINFSIKEHGFVELKIYDIKGRLIKQVINQKLEGGEYDVTWNGKDDKGKDVYAGMYFIYMRIGKTNHVKKMVKLGN